MTDPIRLRARLPASIGAARRAWTDAAALRHWLAEHAEAEPGRYAFWGRHTPQGEEPRQRPLHLGDRTLRFSWELSGEQTIVEVLLEEDAGSTVVTLSQTCFDGTYSGYPSGIVLTVFWSLALGNLADHLLDRPTTPKCDYTARDLRMELAIGAPRAAVFGSLTDSEKFSRWFGLPVEIEPYAGGIWTIRRGGPIGASWTGWLSAISSLRRYHELEAWRPLWLDA